MDPTFLVVVCAVSLPAFVITSAVGIGSAMVLVPLLMMQLPAANAVSLVAPVTLVGNLSRVWLLRSHLHRRAAWLSAAPAVPMAALFALFTAHVDAALLKLAVGVVVLATLVVEWRHAAWVKMGGVGLVVSSAGAGALSGLCGLAGPPAALALRAYGLNKETLVVTLSLLGVLIQAVKIPSYVATGAMPLQLWPLALALALLSLLGAWLATRLLERMSADRFRQLLNGLLALVAFTLIGQGVAERWL